MTAHRDLQSLRDMLEYSHLTQRLIRGKTRAGVESDEVVLLALRKALEIVGEAARRLSPELRGRHPHVPWVDIIGMRNWLTHRYDAIDPDTLWKALHDDVPALILDLERILAREAPPE
jgi:uncharacterized protein with HEPN domain